MAKEIQFGVGCFHFGIKKNPPFKFSASNYVKEIESFLQAVPNISKINVKCDPFGDTPIDIEDELPSIENGTFPQQIRLEVRFQIYIPRRVQKDLIEDIHVVRVMLSERFNVSIFETYHCPVTFIEPINPSKNDKPDDSIFLVRRFLQLENSKSKSDYIDFQTLGPSPFHANFYIRQSKRNKKAPPFWFEKHEALGFDDVVYFYDSDVFDSIDHAKEFIFREISVELGLFYYVVQMGSRKMSQWQELSEEIDRVVELHKKKGPIGVVRRFLSGSQLNDVFISIAEFESNDIFIDQSIRESYGNVYASKGLTRSIKPYVDKAIMDQTKYPTKQLVDLANLFENRRQRLVDSTIVLVSAVLGGLVGSLLTLFFARP